jgi:hypothetical protein
MKLRVLAGAVMTAGVLGVTAAPAFAHDCTVPNRPVTAGAKAILDMNGDPISLSPELLARLQHQSGDKIFSSLHGWLAFDVTGDGVPDVGTFTNTPGFVLPAAERGGTDPKPCNGVTDMETAFDAGCFTPPTS